MIDRRSSRARMVAMALAAFTAIVLLLSWHSAITGSKQELDSEANIRAALNMSRTGVFSDLVEAPSTPRMEREPLPAFTGAIAILITDALLGPGRELQDYVQGERVMWLKHQNVIWLAMLCACIYATARLVGLEFFGSMFAVIGFNLLLLWREWRTYYLDSLYSEAPATLLLTLSSYLLARAFLHDSRRSVLLAGIVMGLLALTKASFFYVFFGVASLTVLFMTRRYPLHRSVLHAAILAAGFSIVVGPWAVRNYVHFQTFSIAGRGGEMLFTRGEMDQKWTRDEYLGGFYYYAPYPLNAVLRRAFGYSREDTTRIGGRLQHIAEASGTEFAAADFAAHLQGRPDKTYTYFLGSVAEHYRLLAELQAKGDPDPAVTSDKMLKARGMELIKANPGKHLALTALLMYRGAFFVFPPLLLAFLIGLRRDLSLSVLTMPALGLLAFYALVSIFTGRYSYPAAPITIIATLALLTPLLRRGLLQLRGTRA